MAAVNTGRRGFDQKYGSLFGPVFVATYLLTMLVFPLLLLANNFGQPESGGAFAIGYLFSLGTGAVLLLKSVIVAVPVFLILAVVADRFLPECFAFVVACAISAFVSCYVAVHVNIDIYPFEIKWETAKPMAAVLGQVAATIALFVSAVVWRMRAVSE